MSRKQRVPYSELDVLLDALAESPDTFEAEARELARAWNSTGKVLELRDPESWRDEAPVVDSVLRIEDQLRAEIDVIHHMDREEEARHARRIEFARLRLELSLEEAGLKPDDLEGHVQYDPSTFADVHPSNCSLPPKVCRHWVELHALRTELVERNLYLVLINVERYAHLSVPRLDLVQEGSAALFRAVDGFDWRRGLLFRTYAVHWLNQAFRSHLYNHGQTVRVPVYLQKAMRHVRLAQERLGAAASPEAIADHTGLGQNLVESALSSMRSTLSMDTPMGGDADGSGLADLLGYEDEDGLYRPEMEDISLSEGLTDALGNLGDRERMVLELRFGLEGNPEHTLAQVAEILGVSLERVRQIQVRALGKLKTPTLRKAVAPFL